MDSLLLFVLVWGATARLTRLITTDRLPFARLRAAIIRRWGSESLPAEGIRCDWCIAIWVAAAIVPLAFVFGASPWFFLPAAILTSAQVAAMANTIV